MRKLHLIMLCLLAIAIISSCNKQEDIIGENNEVVKNAGLSYEENFVDSLNAIYSETDGVIALFGYKDIPKGFNPMEEDFMMSKERIICITTVDKNSQTLNESEATIVVCDSTFFPVHIANKGINIIVSKTDDSHFDCIVYTQENDEWIEYNNFEYNLEDISRVISTRAPAVGGYSEFNLNNALKVLSISTNIVNYYCPLNIATLIPTH